MKMLEDLYFEFVKIFRRMISYFLGQVLGAKILQILDCDSAISVSIQNLQVTFDVSSRGGEDSVEWFVGVNDHRDYFNAVDNSVFISIISLEDSPGNLLGTIAIGQSWVHQNCWGLNLLIRARSVGSLLLVCVVLHLNLSNNNFYLNLKLKPISLILELLNKHCWWREFFEVKASVQWTFILGNFLWKILLFNTFPRD